MPQAEEKDRDPIERLFESVGRKIIRFRFICLAVIATILLITALGLPRLEFDTTIENYFPKDSPIFAKKQKFNAHFGNSDFVACLIRADDIFKPKILRMMQSLSDELKAKVPFADEVISLVDTTYCRSENGRIVVDRLVPEPVPSDPEKIAHIREQALSKELLADKIISKDGTEAWLVLQLEPYPENWKNSHHLSPTNAVGKKALEILSQPEYQKFDIQPTGWPVMVYEELIFTKNESAQLMTVAIVLAVLVLTVFLRSFRGVITPFLISIISLVIVFGMMGYLNIRVNALLFSVPVVLILAISIGYSIHLFNYFNREFYANGSRKEAVYRAVRRAGWPICFSALTTIGALLSFVAIQLLPIQWLGTTSAVLIFCGYILVMTLAPILLSLGNNETARSDTTKTPELWSDKHFINLTHWIFNHSKAVLIVFVCILLFCIYGLTKIEININTENTYGPDVPYVNRMLEIADSDLGAFNTYNVLLDFNRPNAVKNPNILKKFETYIQKVRDLKLTKKTYSILGILKEMNRLKHDGDDAYYKLPDGFIALGELFMEYEMLAEGPDLSRWLSDDYSMLRLQVGTNGLNAQETNREIDFLQKKAHELFPEAKINITGGMPEYAALNHYVAKGQINSVCIALAVIALLMIIVFRNVRLGLIGLIPNITPLLVIGGFMGLTHTPLDFLTITIAPMILGLSVDDTIHFLDYIKSEYRFTQNYLQATSCALKVVGRALFTTTFVIVVAFSIYGFSDLNIMVNLGILVILGITSALLADYFVTPILIKWTRPFGKEKH
ncbi:MAG: MMPL family transporter [Desulfobacterales bacterium]|nr:MMPL family transporter [Desulfobacterales bacterium]